ncbi:hornerin-like [Tetranychus urticae]|uniref:Uncharacterized protein n=1 Tax=Tetranychus urticae TaxID=32264 RepID=T1L4G8_TETUR|nr:hornerin-like [Tetranychus urticae]
MAWINQSLINGVFHTALAVNLLLTLISSNVGTLDPSDNEVTNEVNDLQVAETIPGKAYSADSLDEGHHESGGKLHYQSHHGEKQAGHGHSEDFREAGHLKKGKGGHRFHDVGSHHKEAGSAVGHVDSKAHKEHKKVLKHSWDRGGGFVKKWHWDKGAHLEKEHSDASKKHLAHKKHHHHKEAGKRSKGKKADHQHHKEAHKKEHHKASHGQQKKLQSGQFKESAHHEKDSKRKHESSADEGRKWSGWGSGGYDSGWDGPSGGGYSGWSSPMYGKHGSGWSGIRKYLKPTFDGLNEFAGGGLDTFASSHRYQVSKEKPSSPMIIANESQKPTKSTLIQTIYPKNWKYGHIFGTGLNFLLPRSEY